MTTTERIANAIKHILEEDRRADRERIAELERDAAHMQLRVDLALCGDNELHATIDDLNRQLDEAHKKVAALAAQNNRLHAANAVLARERSEDEPAPVVEEQGPWVIRTAQGRYESRNKWRLARDPDGALQFQTSETAEQHIASFKPDEWDAHQKPFQVMTVDEARAIEAKRNG